MLAGSQGHGTRAYPAFRKQVRGRRASLLLARSKAALRAGCFQSAVKHLDLGVSISLQGVLYLCFKHSQLPNVLEQYFLFICRSWYTWRFDSNLLWYSKNKILKLLCLLC